MELVKPAFGLIFWMCISFGLILFILKKFAWKPILTMLSEREDSIQQALDSAEKAKNEMAAKIIYPAALPGIGFSGYAKKIRRWGQKPF